MRLFAIAFGILAVLTHPTHPTPLTRAADASPQLRADAAAPVFGYAVQDTYPHDPDAFTQGLEYVNGYLYESCLRSATFEF